MAPTLIASAQKRAARATVRPGPAYDIARSAAYNHGTVIWIAICCQNRLQPSRNPHPASNSATATPPKASRNNSTGPTPLGLMSPRSHSPPHATREKEDRDAAHEGNRAGEERRPLEWAPRAAKTEAA